MEERAQEHCARKSDDSSDGVRQLHRDSSMSFGFLCQIFSDAQPILLVKPWHFGLCKR